MSGRETAWSHAGGAIRGVGGLQGCGSWAQTALSAGCGVAQEEHLRENLNNMLGKIEVKLGADQLNQVVGPSAANGVLANKVRPAVWKGGGSTNRLGCGSNTRPMPPDGPSNPQQASPQHAF